jgi:glycosyltransferase involved in cell wall biosynthesis
MKQDTIVQGKIQGKDSNNSKKTLVIATDSFLPRWDGIARFLSEIISRLHTKYNIVVIAPDFGTYEDPNIKIIRIPLMKFFKVGDFPIPAFKRGTINSVIKNADLVFTQTLGPVGSSAIKAAKKYNKPVASFIHSIDWELVPKALGTSLLKKYGQIIAKNFAKKMYNKSDLLIMPAQNILELFLWNNIKTNAKIVHLGVDTKKFAPATSSQAEDIRSQLGLKPNDIVIGYHGRIGREKDLITLLRAYSRIQQLNDNVKLLIVGDGVDSVKKQLASRPGVILTGSKNNPIPYLQAMDIYVMPSLTETTCLSALEAMSCELPVISTEVGFIKSYIKPGYNGLFFEKQNQYPLAKHIQTLLNDPELRKKLGKNARRTVIEQFSWDKTAVGIEEALLSIERRK